MLPPTSAVVVLLPELDALVHPFRLRMDPATVQGVGAHLTVLYPFLAPADLTAEAHQTLARIAAAQAAFPCTLTGPSLHEGLLFLAPEPAAPVRQLRRSILNSWPELLPYRGRYGPDPLPHLTLGYNLLDPEAARQEVAAALSPHLPRVVEVGALSLLIRDGGYWQEAGRFVLGTPRPTMAE